MNFRSLSLATLLSLIVLPYVAAQTFPPTLAASALTAVPPLVPYSGQVEGRTGQTSATFLIYKDQTGGEPLFTESQMIGFDQSGHYKVQLGAANPHGLPPDLFSTGEARWLEVQIAGQPAEPRVLLASVPYALKAADAATLGGLPASAFALAGSNTAILNATPAAVSPNAVSTVTTTGGTANQVAKFSGGSTIVNSILYDNGTQIGVGTSAPTATLTVNGTMTVDGNSTMNGQVILPATGTATAARAFSSQFLKFNTSAYSSASKSVVPPRFQLQAEPYGNDTSSPNASLNLLASATSSPPTETGLYFLSDGTIHFAPNQVFQVSSSTNTPLAGLSTVGSGVQGGSQSAQPGTAGVAGYDDNDEGRGIGVFGGNADALSATGLIYKNQNVGAGVWGDSSFPFSSNFTPGVVGTVDDQIAGFFANSSQFAQTLYAINNVASPNSTAAYLGGVYGGCLVNTSGDLICSGSKSAVVPVDNNTRKVALYAVESPENWFEDFGSGQLSNGIATVTLEPVFAQTVNLGVDYHVFLTPNGESKGLYISRKTATSFEVRESGSGRSTLAFDYRIVARRKGYETIRLADKTKEQELSRSPLMIAAQRAKEAAQ
jgi:hypothetical protein